MKDPCTFVVKDKDRSLQYFRIVVIKWLQEHRDQATATRASCLQSGQEVPQTLTSCCRSLPSPLCSLVVMRLNPPTVLVASRGPRLHTLTRLSPWTLIIETEMRSEWRLSGHMMEDNEQT